MSEIVKIPISKIMPNDDQPRHRFKMGSIEEMAESLKTFGQLTPIKVRPFTAQEKASHTKEELEWFKLTKGNPGATIGERGFEYMIIGGHRRHAGALLAGFETLDCIVLNIAPEETHLTSLMDNSTEEMDWWDWDLAIEAESKAFPNMSQRDLAKRLGVSKSKVNNALVLTKLIDQNDRDWIHMNLDPNCGSQGNLFKRPGEKYDTEEALVHLMDKSASKYRITENHLLALIALEDRNYVGTLIDIIIKKEMAVEQVKKLVQWVNKGNEPEDFDHQKSPKDKSQQSDPLAEDWKALGPGIKVKYKGGEDYEIHLTVTGGDKALKTARAAQKAIRGGFFA
jgi:hypothetical protein